MRVPFIRLRRLHRPDVWESCGVLRIGRLPGCEVCLDDASVSRFHATIRPEGGRWSLADSGSTHGTLLDGVRLGWGVRAVLGQGNSVRVGDVVLVVESVDAVTEAGWFSRQADPKQVLALLRQHPLSHLLPSIEGAIGQLVADETRSLSGPYLWSDSNTSPVSMHGGGERSVRSEESDDIRWSVLHEAVRNPFRSFGGLATGVLTWNGGTVVNLARTIWESSDFSLMPILADALEEAGCDERDILAHCRQRTQHLRCCWALRAVLSGENDRHV